MPYCQLNSDQTYLRELPDGNYSFDENVFQPASTLSDEQKALYRVVPLFPIGEPAFDRVTQQCQRDGAELVDGQWQYKWAASQLDPTSLQASVVNAVQARLDAFAHTRNYDGILSACTYVSSSVPKFAAEGAYAVSARDQTWATLYSAFAEVLAGTRPMPTLFAEIEALLPVLEWPA